MTFNYATPVRTIFGSGADGNVVIASGITTLIRDMCYNNLTINGTGQLNTAGYRVYVSGVLDISAAPVDAIYWFGGSANGSGATGGVLAQLYGETVTAPSNTGQANGGAGQTGVGTTATSVASTSAFWGTGGAGGTGGVGGASTNAGGLGATCGAPSAQVILSAIADPLSTINAVFGNPGYNGGGGGGGGGDGTHAGGGGGSGGTGGGSIWLYANIIQRGTNSTASIIQAKGAGGGTGAVASLANAAGGGGGGAGGGGCIYIVAGNLLGSTITNALDVSGGHGGSGGNGLGTGKGGGGGNGGNGGATQVTILSPASFTTSAFNAAATSGGTTTTATGAAGGAGATQQANL